MKKKLLPFLSVFALLTLVGCSGVKASTTEEENNTDGDYSYNEPITIDDPTDIDVEEPTGEFSISTTDGAYTKTGNIYKLTQAGTYTLAGKLTGQILVEVSTGEVVIELNNVSITYDQDSPIKVTSADKVEISAKSGTGNTITDNRNKKTVDTDTLGEGAIYAKCDMKLKGSGTLVVTGNYNNGIHCTKDLTIQKETLKVTGYNNAIRGNSSVTITSGEVQAYATTGNGIKTVDSDLSSKGKQRGTIAINGGAVYVDSLHDALDAAYNVQVDQLDSTVATTLSIKTGKNSQAYSASTFKADSEKGLKAANDVIVNKGTIIVAASDDAIHANYGTVLYTDDQNNKVIGTGNITINDGLIQVAAGDDGLHADNTLSINGGKVVVTNATEGFEANYINITGGYSYIYGTDDGVNCSKKSFNNCAITISGGYLDVAVKSGDTDGIDSNGNVTISGGVIVTRGSPNNASNMSTGLDVDGTCSMTGGTLIAFNGLEKKPTTSSSVRYAGTANAASSGWGGGGPGGPGHGGGGSGSSSSSVSLQNGKYTLVGDGFNLSFTNDYSYSSFLVYSTNLTLNSSYTLSRNDTTVLSWTQSSSSVTISQ